MSDREDVPGPLARYRRDLASGQYVHDASQQQAAEALDDLHRALCEAGPASAPAFKRWLPFVPNHREPVRGLYLWGGVGRGKTWLMDCFHDCLPFRDRMRRHFHRFMQDVHDDLKRLKQLEDPLATVAERLSRRARVICFDEFFVSDIADAMILGRLFESLFERGVTLVATSNVPPDDLYREGLQRARFLPTIDRIKRHTRVLNVDGGIDYRLRILERAEIYHVPADTEADEILEKQFLEIAPEPGRTGVRLTIEGRPIRARREADGVLWLDFSEACEGPRGQADYIELARVYHTVCLSGVPRFDAYRENEARRFVALVDEFYDRGVKLFITADAELADLYAGNRLRFEFGRTVSRLREMQTHDYLAREHRP